MKRSEINRIISEGISFLDSRQYRLPPSHYFIRGTGVKEKK